MRHYIIIDMVIFLKNIIKEQNKIGIAAVIFFLNLQNQLSGAN